jgi:hypothetical protein
MQDYEKLGTFYLGKEYSLKEKAVEDDLVLYDSKDLVTHGVVLGMTGSGKTGLCLSLLEEAAMDNIPAIVIDPKGDIANLMLSFPEFRGEDFRPWINESDALKKQMDPDAYAEKTARMWREGIEEWGQSADRVRSYKTNVDVNIFTPGSKAGVPVSILGSLEAPPFEVVDDTEAFGDCIESSVSSLLSLIGEDGDLTQSHEAVLLGNIFSHYWRDEKDLTLEILIHAIQKPPLDKVGVIGLESYYPEKKRQELAIRFNNLLASPGFSSWLEGPSMDIDSFLYQDNGKARISIFSIAHLSDSERMFFVSTLLNRMLSWMRTQSGTTSLRALLYMDEIYGYLPPTANPASKKPLMTILKQGRAFGLGALLATQNPVDLDYKALSNIGTWWLGRLQTERDKMRVLDGLQGAAASQDGRFDRAAMEELLAGLGSRVFLMNNVHEDAPVVFHVRWVMSYLCGPLTKRQIKKLMDPKRGLWMDEPEEASNPMSMGEGASNSADTHRPVVGNGVQEYFLAAKGEVYQPHLLREATVYFQNAKTAVEGKRVVRKVNPILSDGIDWQHELGITMTSGDLTDTPDEGVGFAELPGFAMHAKNYKAVAKEFVDWVYRNECVEVFYAKLIKQYSKMGESEGAFRARITHEARELRDEAAEKMREKMKSKLRTKEGQLQRALAAVERERAQAQNAQISAGASVLSTIFGTLLGSRKLGSTAVRRGATAARSASRAMQQRKDVELAEAKVSDLQALIDEMKADLEEDIRALEEHFAPELIELERVQVKPYKKDIRIDALGILWMAPV